MIETVKGLFARSRVEVVLTGHSGGGSWTFGYLNAVSDIPQKVRRIAFLDSNYAFESALHTDKLTRWLRNSERHYLGVLACHDAVALLNGKTFVSGERRHVGAQPGDAEGPGNPFPVHQ